MTPRFSPEQLEQIREVVNAPMNTYEVELYDESTYTVEAHSMQPVSDSAVVFFRRVFDQIGGVNTEIIRYFSNVAQVQNRTEYLPVPTFEVPKLLLN